jgi:stage III sporulation protein AD
MFQTVLRTVGIGMLAEFTSLLCADAGNNALGKSIQILAGGLILMISLPIMTQLLDMIEQILQPL